MPFETRWYVPKRLIYQRFYGVVTVEEFAESIQQVEAFMAEGEPLIHAIADVLDIERWPPLLQLSRAAKRQTYPGMGWTVIVVSNPTLRLFTTILGQFTSQYVHSVSNMPDALRFLSSRDTTLHIP